MSRDQNLKLLIFPLFFSEISHSGYYDTFSNFFIMSADLDWKILELLVQTENLYSNKYLHPR